MDLTDENEFILNPAELTEADELYSRDNKLYINKSQDKFNKVLKAHGIKVPVTSNKTIPPKTVLRETNKPLGINIKEFSKSMIGFNNSFINDKINTDKLSEDKKKLEERFNEWDTELTNYSDWKNDLYAPTLIEKIKWTINPPKNNFIGGKRKTRKQLCKTRKQLCKTRKPQCKTRKHRCKTRKPLSKINNRNKN